MNKRESLWEAYLAKGFSRRNFLKGCVTLTSLMGLSTDNLSKVVEAAEAKPLPVVIWLHGHECTGCDESFIRSGAPLASDLVLNEIALEYSHLLCAGEGEAFEAHLEETIKKYHGEYILAVEGAVPIGEHAYTCMSGGHSFEHTLKHVAEGAKAVIAYGTCATAGGIQAAAPNPTESRGIRSLIGAKPYIAVPGCPPIPEVMTGVVMHVALFGTLPPLDGEGRPRQFYGNRIHDTCYRRPFFDAGMFAERFDDAGAKGAGASTSSAAAAPRRTTPAAICAGIRDSRTPSSRAHPVLAAAMRTSGIRRRSRSVCRSTTASMSTWSAQALPSQRQSVLRRTRARALYRRDAMRSSSKKRESRCMNETRRCRPNHPY